MPAKQVVVSSGRPQKGFFASAYDEITHPENATVVRSLLVFGVSCHSDFVVYLVLSEVLTVFLVQAGVAFLHSSLGELLLPP